MAQIAHHPSHFHGVTMTLTFGDERDVTTKFYFDPETGIEGNGQDCSTHLLFTLAQWLAESGLIPYSDNKGIIGENDERRF